MSFTVGQFIDVFHRYNEAIWPLQLVAYALGVVLVALLFSRSTSRHRVIPAALAVYWAFMGVVFMWAFETDIMKAAYLFGALFVVEAGLLLWHGVVRARIVFEPVRGARLAAGLAMIAYALVAYPVIGALAGHGYPDAPLFGVAPCPTVIFTFGLLLTTRRFPWPVALVPLLWAAFGSNAAFRFGIYEDIGLLVSGLVTVGFALAALRRTRSPRTSSPQSAAMAA
jgi:hypothetical protein